MADINNLIVISDLHCGCRAGLCPPKIKLDEGGYYERGELQRFIGAKWDEFWNEWVPRVCRKEKFAVLINGDAVDGAHHGSKTQISQNFVDQENIAYEMLKPIADRCQGRLFMVRGTEAHVGQSAENEERLAKRLGAVEINGQCTQYQFKIRVGHGLVDASHHIGSTSRAAYETSALMGEFMESLIDSAKWRYDPPDCVVRSHRHRHIEVKVPTANTYGIVFTTAAWQGRTPFTYRLLGGRTQNPQFGGSIIRCGDEEMYTRHKVWDLPQSAPIII
ncbi:MAG: hypothetical protein IPH09_13130 [bacterium]|nr:hypothetical protein [bacterium]